jgi:hypothetical protein
MKKRRREMMRFQEDKMSHFMKSSCILIMKRKNKVMTNQNLNLLITLKTQKIGRKSKVAAKSTGSVSMV